MAGMYVHIPFCRKICSYCDFYKTALTSLIPDFLGALEKELEDRKNYLGGDALETIYLGGGTPSLINTVQLAHLFDRIAIYNRIAPGCEVTIEANPDDLTTDYLRSLLDLTPINRLSIGIQSFNDVDLKLLNRRHDAFQAEKCLNDARKAGFENISIDLIYGLPGMNISTWKDNLDKAFSNEIQHLSAYHLTIEPHTAFARMSSRGLINLPADDESALQFKLLNRMAGDKGFNHYEISNLARNGCMSKHNANYWLQKKYIGLGPSGHSYNLVSRQWNVANVRKYMDALSKGEIYTEAENLDAGTRFNEYLMLSLRTSWGVSFTQVTRDYGEQYAALLEKNMLPFLSSPWIIREGDSLKLTPDGWMVSDYIVSRLMAE